MITDYTGKKFGRLLVVERIPNGKIYPNGKRYTYYRCVCDCGTEVTLPSASLVSGNTKSCGCLRNMSRIRTKSKRPYQSPYRVLCRVAERMNREIDITYEDFLEFTKITECCYCGTPINWMPHCVKGIKRSNAYYLDRKDNLIGYTKENCVVCCSRCNHAKMNLFTHAEWKKIGEVIKTFSKQEKSA